jgi:predicted TIM-barrel fold metal-dependent hydrolase
LRGDVRTDDLVLISIDDHLIEPPDMFERHLHRKYRDNAPQIVKGHDGAERWVFQGAEIGSVGLNAVASWPKSEWTLDAVSFAEMRPACYDVHERVRDMDAAGIYKSMCFPTMGGFSGRVFNESADKELAGAVVRAYNDWHIEDWCGVYPERFIPLGVLPIWDLDASVAELRRLASLGVHAVSFPETPYALGLPSFQSGYWNPLLKAASELGVVLCLHIGLGIRLITTPPDGAIDNFIVVAAQISAITAADLLLGPTLREFPDLKIAMSEAGIGWIPYFLHRADRHQSNQVWTGTFDAGGRSLSDIYRDHVLSCFITDPDGLALRHRIGVDNIAWECDYPHSDSTWPDAAELLNGEFNGAGVTDDEIDKITWQNSCRFFRLEPFQGLSRTEATVGALRLRATDVDTSETPRATWAARYVQATT